MEQKLQVIVEIKSKELIKPSLPPSSHPQTFTLSLLDQIFPAYHMPLLLFYTATASTTQGGVDISSLKASLSQTLDKFYPIAGRLLNESTVICNDEGIPFIETKVHCHLSEVLNSPNKLELLPKFFPPQELDTLGPRPFSEVVPLAFQINVFLCGGMAIGCNELHKLLDALSFANFFKYWSGLASKRYKDLVQPDFEAIVKAFPPLPEEEQVFVPDIFNSEDTTTELQHPIIVVKSFVFSAVALSNLKARAASELVPRPSRFEALVGFLWQHALAAANRIVTPTSKHTVMSISINMRPRMNPPLPMEAVGNLVTNGKAQANEGSTLQELVKEIRSTVSNINQKITEVYQRENGAQVICAERKAEIQAVMGCKEGFYRLSSLCHVGFYEADFGFGKPAWVLPIDGKQLPPALRNCIYFTDNSSLITGDGIEVWLFLEEKEMQVLESDPGFLAYATPS